MSAHWLRDVVSETVGTGPGLAWELLESELLHLLALEVKTAYPGVKESVSGVGPALTEARESAKALIARHEAQVESRRESFARVAIASMQVQRAHHRAHCPLLRAHTKSL